MEVPLPAAPMQPLAAGSVINNQENQKGKDPNRVINALQPHSNVL